MRFLRTSLVFTLGLLTVGPDALAQSLDRARASIAVFPLAAPELPKIEDAVLDKMTAKINTVIATESGFLTVPRMAIHKALESGGHDSKPGTKSLEELIALANMLEEESNKAIARIKAAKEAQEVSLESHEARAAYAVFLAEETAARATAAAKKAKKTVEIAKAKTRAAIRGGGCWEDVCRAKIGKRVGASKTLRSTFLRTRSKNSAEACALELKFFNIEAGHTDLTINSKTSCSEKGLLAAIKDVAGELKMRDKAGYEVYKLDLVDGQLITNKPTKRTGTLRVLAKAEGDPNEGVEVWLNGENKGDVRRGLFGFTGEFQYGHYIVVVKSKSDLFSARRFDITIGSKPVQIPVKGAVVLKPVYGAISFDLVAGPWELRTGSQMLVAKETNTVRPGNVPVQIYLEDEPIGEVSVKVMPSKTSVLKITARPTTKSETAKNNTVWAWRKWGSLSLATILGAAGGERLISAYSSQSDRETTLAALADTSQPIAYEMFRSQAVAHESDRSSAQVTAYSLLATAGAAAIWSLVEWLALEPESGDLIVPGHEVLPIHGMEDDIMNDKIPTAKPTEPGALR